MIILFAVAEHIDCSVQGCEKLHVIETQSHTFGHNHLGFWGLSKYGVKFEIQVPLTCFKAIVREQMTDCMPLLES